MRAKVARSLRKQAELTGLSYKGLKRLWNSDGMHWKMKDKWRKIIERQANQAGAEEEIDRIKTQEKEAHLYSGDRTTKARKVVGNDGE